MFEMIAIPVVSLPTFRDLHGDIWLSLWYYNLFFKNYYLYILSIVCDAHRICRLLGIYMVIYGYHCGIIIYFLKIIICISLVLFAMLAASADF